MIKKWIEAMRLRTLPVSLSGVIAGCGCATFYGKFSVIPAILCLLFALFAQIASNFANEYFDFKNGFDKKGREGFRRGVTEGDISPGAMKIATFVSLGIACLIGLMMLFYGGWWLILIGISVVVFALAYSTGPYPLSHHGLGDVAVIVFFGIVPVTLTCFLQMGNWNGFSTSLPVSLAIGLLAANVLIVNNYRDMDDDKEVNKHTTAVIFGRKVIGYVYLASGIIAMLILFPVWNKIPWQISVCAVLIYLIPHIRLWRKLTTRLGAQLNPILGKTAMLLLLFTLVLTTALCLSNQ